MKTPRIVLVLVLVFAACIAGWYGGSHVLAKKRSCVLGVIGNFKGKNSQVGVESFNAITLAYDEYKKAHPGGFDLFILPVDNSWDFDKSRPAYLSCADEADLLIILSGSSHIMMIYDDMLKRSETVHAVLGPTTTLLSGKKDNVVRNIMDLEKEQIQIAAFASSLGIKRLLIVMEADLNGEYTEPAGEHFRKHVRIPQIDVVRFSGHLMDTEKAREMLRNGSYDAMYALVGGMPREAGILIQQARVIQPGIPVLVSPWIRGMIFEQALGAETNGIFMPCHLKLTDNPTYDHFTTAYQQMFGVETKEYFVPLMYDLANSLFAALQKAKTPKAAALLPVLLAGQREGTMGITRFDAFGDADNSLSFYELVDGIWRFLPQKADAPVP